MLIQFTDEDWKDNYRMTCASYNEMVSLVAPFMNSKPEYVRAPVPFKKKAAIALYKIAS